MSYYCKVCYKTIKLKSKGNHLNSLSHEEFDECNYKKITNKDPDINKKVNAVYEFIIEQN